MSFHKILFKYKTIISIACSLIINTLLLQLINPPHSWFYLGILLILYVIHYFSISSLIYIVNQKRFTSHESLITSSMKLISNIIIVHKNQQQFAQFFLSNKEYKIKFEVETNKGTIGQVYSELNIDYIMIKKDKIYNVGLLEQVVCFEELQINKNLTPISIDHYSLQEVFCLYKITSKFQTED
jgi:hypothetical protein